MVRTFAIVTTGANTPMRAVHDRMPVILAPDDWAAWLEDEDPAAWGTHEFQLPQTCCSGIC